MKTNINSFKGSKFALFAGVLTAVIAIVSIPAAVGAQTFTQTLKFGSRGGEVSQLQTVLAEDNVIYPQGLVTGYFGSLTKAAVIRFQSQKGLGADGIVGPITRLALNSGVSGGVSSGDLMAPMISGLYINPSRNGATIGWNTNEAARATVYYSTSPLNPMEVGEGVTIGNANSAMANTGFGTANAISVTNLQPNTTYYYMVHSVDQSGNTTVTWPSTFTTPNN